MKSEFLNERVGLSAELRDASSKFIATAKNISKKMSANYMQKKKAYETSKEQFNKTGSLDLSRIANYKTSDDIFKKKTMTKTGTNHGLVCALDFSGSMGPVLSQVAMQFLITALFAKQIKIPFIFYTFTTVVGNNAKDIVVIGQNENNKTEYSDNTPRFTIIATDKNSEADIINTYYHILSLHAIKRYSTINFTRKYINYLVKYYSTGATPLIHATYQNYLLAYTMKQRGIENVNILTIADGDNNVWFASKVRAAGVRNNFIQDAIECPYTKRVYTTNQKDNDYYTGRDHLISVINRMTRTAGIKTFNMFIANNMHHKKVLRSTVDTVCNGHDNRDDVYKVLGHDNMHKMQNEIKDTYMAICDNLCYYNKVFFTSTNIFPTLTSEDDEFDAEKTTAYKYLKQKAESNKGLTSIGKLISDIMVEDFKIGF